MPKPRKNTRGEKSDFSREEKLKFENKKLKREVAQLRRTIKKMDVDRYHNIQDIVNQTREDEAEAKATSKKMLAKWKCHECSEGHMAYIPVSRKDGMFYYRKCTECDNRTKMKKETKDTEKS